MTNPIPVNEWLKKAQTPAEGLKLVSITGTTSDENNAGDWITAEVIEGIKKEAHDTRVASYSLPDLKVYPCHGCFGGGNHVCTGTCDRNDIESSLYRPEDAMIRVYEKIRECDILLVTADARWGGLNHLVQRFLERMTPFANASAAGRNTNPDKLAGIITTGDGSLNVAGQLMAALNAFGFSFPRYAFVAWHVPRLSSRESVQQAYEQSQAVHKDAELLAASLAKYASLLKGA